MKIKPTIQISLLFLLTSLFATGTIADTGKVPNTLVILSSNSLQTQGMAMVLGNTMQAQGARVRVLLCDEAGDLALAKKADNQKLKPKNVSPKMLLGKLRKGGASVSVCALYLPNSNYTKADLMKGVGVAKPPEIAALMLDKNTRVFTF
ncbi:MAG: hypothetical protein CSB48_08395 [Proteobacteria bacterium]|nr:MAG: hypothetical protein CSB48_08395 [Pseudomonadota bacterium]